MPKPNNNLVSTKITDTSKIKLEFIKAYYSGMLEYKDYCKSDYASLEHLINNEYYRVIHLIKNK